MAEGTGYSVHECVEAAVIVLKRGEAMVPLACTGCDRPLLDAGVTALVTRKVLQCW